MQKIECPKCGGTGTWGKPGYAKRTCFGCDGEETVIKRSTDKAAILAVMHSTDEDYICCHGMPHNPPENFRLAYCKFIDGDDALADEAGWIRLIYGNEAAYVLSDHSTALSPWLDANDSNYQRWFRYIDDFKWGTPSPLDAKLATMRELLDASVEAIKSSPDFLKLFKAGRDARHTGVVSQHGAKSLEQSIHCSGWVYEDLRLGLAKVKPSYRRVQEHNDPQFVETMKKWEAAGKPSSE